ncbi:hypothetical protein FA09DRAFT_357883 [Tilletiopsis washingtonensis]|uniref:Signal recognition particle subunit SRP14 n=1 Tax=Tilletiopsis washingtonensis TaxID=58919 RepID=A0A316ZID5_9BASI|nr:hypothetical protein FA09DRAFT_357883 [Tilletiopsis washingtonensis]PWO01292.1 hypothetical protein FA09DRAFT_357883 [Tilletiopsis washingtonensis]
MPHIANDVFHTRLATLFAEATEAHSVYLTTKRLTRGDEAMSATPVTGGAQHALLFRASDGREGAKRSQFSTVVQPSALPAFQTALDTVLRTSLAASLRKRDKAKERRVDKARKESAKRIEEQGGKIRLADHGSKRGAGHKKRQQAAARAKRVRAERARTFAAAKDEASGSGAPAAAS